MDLQLIPPMAVKFIGAANGPTNHPQILGFFLDSPAWQGGNGFDHL